MKDEGVKKCSVLIAIRRMHQHSGRFVHDYEMGVLKNDVERNILRPHRVRHCRVELDLNEISASDPKSDVLEPSVNFASFFLNDPAEIHPTKPWELSKEVIFESCARNAVGNLNLDPLVHGEILSYLT